MTVKARRIRDVLDVGSASGGHDVRLNIRMEDGSTEWFDIEHSRIGRFVAGVMSAASAAQAERVTSTPLGNSLPSLSTLIDIVSLNASAAPGTQFVCLRLSLSPEVHLDFRIPLESVPAMTERLQQAVRLAQSGTSPLRQ